MSETPQNTEMTRVDLSAVAAHVDSMLQSHRDRVEQIGALSDTIHRFQDYCSKLEDEVLRLRGELAETNNRLSISEKERLQALSDNRDLVISHAGSIQRIEEDKDAEIQRISAAAAEEIKRIRDNATHSIEELRLQAERVAEQARSELDGMRDAYDLVVGENDRLNHTVTTLTRAIASSNEGVGEEQQMISDMMRALHQRLPRSPEASEHDSSPSFLRSVNSGENVDQAFTASPINRVA